MIATPSSSESGRVFCINCAYKAAEQSIKLLVLQLLLKSLLLLSVHELKNTVQRIWFVSDAQKTKIYRLQNHKGKKLT